MSHDSYNRKREDQEREDRANRIASGQGFPREWLRMLSVKPAPKKYHLNDPTGKEVWVAYEHEGVPVDIKICEAKDFHFANLIMLALNFVEKHLRTKEKKELTKCPGTKTKSIKKPKKNTTPKSPKTSFAS